MSPCGSSSYKFRPIDGPGNSNICYLRWLHEQAGSVIEALWLRSSSPGPAQMG